MSEEIIKVPLPEIATGEGGALLANFQNALMAIDDYRQQLATNNDWESLCYGLANLVEFKQSLAALVDSIQGDIYKIMPDKKAVIEGLGTFEKRRSNSKKWDSERLLNDIVSEKLDNGTGEITPTDVFELIDMLKRVLPLTASMGWRVGELKKENVNTDDYCDVTWGRPTVTVQK